MAVGRLHRRLAARLRASLEQARGTTIVETMVRSLDRAASLQRRALRAMRFLVMAVLVVAYLFVIFDLFRSRARTPSRLASTFLIRFV